MKRQKWKILGALALLFIGTAGGLYLANATPVVPAIAANDPVTATRPYVVKLHAQWCPVCMMTIGVWSDIQKTYAGRVNLVVFDFTNEKTTQASRAEAKRLGLEAFLDEYGGATGLICILDGKTKQVVRDFSGDRNFANYRSVLDAVLTANK